MQSGAVNGCTGIVVPALTTTVTRNAPFDVQPIDRQKPLEIDRNGPPGRL